LAGNLSVIAVLKLIDGYTAPHHIDSDGVKERTIRIFFEKIDMRLDNKLFDSIQEQAEDSPRRRMNYDLRTSAEDSSQRMINVLMSDTVIPIHRHTDTSETVVICRGAIREEFYDDQGHKTAEFILRAGGDCPAIQVPKGVFHTSVCLEDGSVIFEAKDGAYKPISPEDVL
jgi:hypothetical protein